MWLATGGVCRRITADAQTKAHLFFGRPGVKMCLLDVLFLGFSVDFPAFFDVLTMMSDVLSPLSRISISFLMFFSYIT